MEPVLLPLACFGNIAYYSALLDANSVTIEKHEHFVKQSFRNRYHVSGPNGVLNLSIPVSRGHAEHTPYKDIKISCDEDWQVIHWRSLEASYRSSPYFEYYEDDIRPLFNERFDTLFEFNTRVLHIIHEQLQEPLEVAFTEEYIKEPEGVVDMRSTALSKKFVKLYSHEAYQQVFEDRNGFLPNLSVLDALFNLGPNTLEFLRKAPTPTFGT